MTRTLLHFDPGHGASGDMVIGALVDLGVPPEVIGKAVRAVGGPEGFEVTRGFRHGMAGTKVRFTDARGQGVDSIETGGPVPPIVVRQPARGSRIKQNPATPPHDHAHGHDHAHDHAAGHAHHHPYADVVKRISRAPLPTDVRDLALAILRRLGSAESQVHGIPLDEVALHEVAAADSIGDIVGAAAALRHLDAARITCGPFGVCTGSIRMQHGVLPGPGPATGLILLGAPIVGLTGTMETVTPTGAAILVTAAHAFGPPPAMVLTAQGHGLGHRDPPERANVLRAWLGEDGRTAHKVPPADVVQLECNVDDATPQVMAHAAQRCLDAGALDAWLTPVIMKKGRPGYTLHALVVAGSADALVHVMMMETPTLGVRQLAARRSVATRETVAVTTSAGRVRVKVARQDGVLLHAQPEMDDSVAAARRARVPVADVLAEARAHAHQPAVAARATRGTTRRGRKGG